MLGHQVPHARRIGWHELKNGDLLQRAEAEEFEVIVTTDRNIRYQQNLTGRRIAIVPLSSSPSSLSLRSFRTVQCVRRFKYVKELRAVQTEARYRRESGIRRGEPSVLTETKNIDRAIDKSATAQHRAKVVTAMEYAAKANASPAATTSTAPEQAKPIAATAASAGFRLRDLLPHRK